MFLYNIFKIRKSLTTLRICLKVSTLFGSIFYLLDRDDYQNQINNLKLDTNLPTIVKKIIPKDRLIFMNSLSNSIFKKYLIGKKYQDILKIIELINLKVYSYKLGQSFLITKQNI